MPVFSKFDMCKAYVLTLLIAGNSLSVDSEIIEDLTRLCVIFEHVEKLLTVAASLHRKFLQAPRLSEAIFSDFYNFYLPKMGTGSGSHDIDKVNFFGASLFPHKLFKQV
mgnify:CR=1 FL=1